MPLNAGAMDQETGDVVILAGGTGGAKLARGMADAIDRARASRGDRQHRR